MARQGSKAHPQTKIKEVPRPTPLEILQPADSTSETENMSEEETPELSLASEWLSDNAQSEFNRQAAYWLEEFGPDLLAIQIQKKLVAQKASAKSPAKKK